LATLQRGQIQNLAPVKTMDAAEDKDDHGKGGAPLPEYMPRCIVNGMFIVGTL